MHRISARQIVEEEAAKTVDPLQDIASRLENAHQTARANQAIPNKSVWRGLWVNKAYCTVKGSNRHFLVLKGPQLEAADKLIKLLPYAEPLHHASYALLSAPEPDNAKRVTASHEMQAQGYIDYALNCMFFEPIVSRRGMGTHSVHGTILGKDIQYSTEGAKEFAAWLFNGENGWGILRTILWQFGNFDEYRRFQALIT